MDKTDLFRIEASGVVELLDDVCGLTDEEGVAGGPAQHRHHQQPEVLHVSRGLFAIAYAQHVRHGSEQGPAVLLSPVGLLQQKQYNNN